MVQIGSDQDWTELAHHDNMIQKADGTVWNYYFTGKDKAIKLEHRPELDGVPQQSPSMSSLVHLILSDLDGLGENSDIGLIGVGGA